MNGWSTRTPLLPPRRERHLSTANDTLPPASDVKNLSRLFTHAHGACGWEHGGSMEKAVSKGLGCGIQYRWGHSQGSSIRRALSRDGA